MRGIFAFPNPVNEVAARTTALIMDLICLTALGFTFAGGGLAEVATAIVGVVAATFILRAASGPRFDPVAWTVTRKIVPHLGFEFKPTPGPPKRFAQLMGAIFTGAAFILSVAGATPAASALLALVVVFASLESGLGFCAGCQVFGVLMRTGVIPRFVCEECADIWIRQERTARHVSG